MQHGNRSDKHPDNSLAVAHELDARDGVGSSKIQA